MSMPNFILTLELKTEIHQEDVLDKRLEIGRKIYNACLGELFKRYRTIQQSKEYRAVCGMNKGKVRNKKFNGLNKKYGLTEYSLHPYMKKMENHFKKQIGAQTAQALTTRCFRAFQKLMLHEANKVNFKRYGEMNSIEGKTNESGIRFKDNYVYWFGLEIPAIIKENDIYAQIALCNKIKYCRIIRKLIRGKYKFYVQLIMDGIPPRKVDSETGEVRNCVGEGRVGLDIGTQTLAISSESEAKLLELAPEVNDVEKEKRVLQRKMDRQRRANNSHKFNEDKTNKQGNREKWINSNRYIKTKNELAELQRKIAAKRKQSHEVLANQILSLGNKIYVETMNYKEMQARAKSTTINEKTGRFNSNKRFGKSLANKAPSMFLTILDNKLKWHDEELIKINTAKVKASQYNHITDGYTKKSLNERWNDFERYKIQRDLYSAYLIMNVKDNLEEVDRELCFSGWDNFKEMHDKEIERVRNSESRLISSMGI